MKYFFSLLILTVSVYATLVTTPIIQVNGDEATIEDNHFQVGMSGFVVHHLSPNRSSIVGSVEVVRIDHVTNQAIIKLAPYTLFTNNNLPSLQLKPQVGDEVVLTFGYNRGLLIAPNESVYYTLKNAMRNEVLAHPDIFATYLSSKGHVAPLKKDFQEFCNNLSIGLVFFFFEQKLYTVDCQSFAILDVQNAPLQSKQIQKPFYSRIEHIEANWFGAGSSPIQNYSKYYKSLLEGAFPENKEKLYTNESLGLEKE